MAMPEKKKGLGLLLLLLLVLVRDESCGSTTLAKHSLLLEHGLSAMIGGYEI